VADNEATQRLAEILGRIAKLPGANLEPPQFFANFLQLSVAATGSRGGAVWVTQAGQAPQCYCHVDLEACRINDQAQQQVIIEAVQRTVTEAKPLVLPAAGDAVGDDQSEQVSDEAGGERRNLCSHPLFFKPLRAANQVAMVLQLVGSEGLNPHDFRAVVGLLEQIGEAGETYLAHRRATVLEDDRKSLARLLQYAEGVHGSLDPQKVVYEVANLGRDAIGCTRVVVWVDPQVKRGLRAVSGVDKPDRRAVLLQAIEQLCRKCLEEKRPIVASRERLAELPEEEELTGLLKHYFNVSQLDQIFLQPMSGEQERQLGAVVAEGFDEQSSVNLAGVVATVAKHGAVALSNALAMAQAPLVGRMARLAKKPGTRRRKWVVTGVLAVVLALGVLLPWPIKVECACELTPADMRVIDAPLEGVQIVRVLRKEGVVARGEVVLLLSDEELQKQLEMYEADREEELTKNKQARSRDAGSTETRISNLKLESLSAKIKLWQERIAKCQVRAPIAGTILTDRLEQRQGMTVTLGEAIFEMADLNNWELVVDVPQEEVGWVLRGLEERGGVDEGWTVEFYLKAYPEYRLSASLSNVMEIGQMARIKEGGNVFEVRLPVSQQELAPIMAGLREGSLGRAKIATCERALGYVMLRKVIRFFRVTFF